MQFSSSITRVENIENVFYSSLCVHIVNHMFLMSTAHTLSIVKLLITSNYFTLPFELCVQGSKHTDTIGFYITSDTWPYIETIYYIGRGSSSPVVCVLACDLKDLGLIPRWGCLLLFL